MGQVIEITEVVLNAGSGTSPAGYEEFEIDSADHVALTAGVDTGIVVPSGSLLLVGAPCLNNPAVWTAPGSAYVAVGVSQADAVAGAAGNVNDLLSGATDVTSAADTVFKTGVVVPIASQNQGTVVLTTDLHLWVALGDDSGNENVDPLPTGGTATLRVAWFQPAA